MNMKRGLKAGLLFIVCLKLVSFSLVESSATLKIQEQTALKHEKQYHHTTSTAIEKSGKRNEKREEEESSAERVSLKAKGAYGGGSELRHSRPAKNNAIPSSSSSFAFSFSVLLLLFFLFAA